MSQDAGRQRPVKVCQRFTRSGSCLVQPPTPAILAIFACPGGEGWAQMVRSLCLPQRGRVQLTPRIEAAVVTAERVGVA
ncbi:hypothetical protein Mal52_11380 [Symmachiella dynata]|uniref:Uncharacterized protein n=1 Tax=Symmachiella dynata TaxID=2527995 RepID=A0A517ZJM0_9PLAN|nr:hypothetical protein Mal52_11380 [Symmachiella dynata]